MRHPLLGTQAGREAFEGSFTASGYEIHKRLMRNSSGYPPWLKAIIVNIQRCVYIQCVYRYTDVCRYTVCMYIDTQCVSIYTDVYTVSCVQETRIFL